MMFISISIILLHQSIPHSHEEGTGYDSTFWQSPEMNAEATDIFAYFNPGPDHLEDILPGNPSKLSEPDKHSAPGFLCIFYVCEKKTLKKSGFDMQKTLIPAASLKGLHPLLL